MPPVHCVVREDIVSRSEKFMSATCPISYTSFHLMHGVKYKTAIEVWTDGLRMEEPYFPECKLRVRIGMK